MAGRNLLQPQGRNLLAAQPAEQAQEQPLPEFVERRGGRGIGAIPAIRERQESLQQLRNQSPELASLVESVSGPEAFAILAGRGLTNVARGLGLAESEDPAVQRSIEALSEQRPVAAEVGELVGETAPFLLPGTAVGGIARTGARRLATTALGATEAGVLASGRGGDIEETIKGAGLGGAAAITIELGIPVVGRVAGTLFRKITGKTPGEPLIKPDGTPSSEFQNALDQEGIEFDDFVSDAAKTTAQPTPGRLREFAGQADVDPEVLAASQRLGLDESLPASVLSRDEQFIEFEQGLTGIIGSQLSANQKDAIRQTVQKADDFITDFGGTLDKAGLNERIKGQVTQNIETLRTQARESYNALAEAVPAQTPADTSLIARSIRDTAEEVGGIANLDVLDKKLLAITKGTPTYGLIDRERKKVVAQLRGKDKPFPDASTFQLEKALDVLTETQGQIARQFGAEDLWNTAKTLVAKRKQLEKEAVSNLGRDQTKAILPALGAGLKDLSKGDVQKFTKALSGIPENLRSEAIFTAMNDVFTAGGRSQSQMSMPGFTAWFDKLNKNKTAKAALINKMPTEAAERLEDIATVAKAFSKATAETARTGRIQTLLNDFDQPNGMLSKIYGVARAGSPLSPTAGAATSVIVDALAKGKVPTAKAADGLLSSPQFRRLVIAEMNAPGSRATERARSQMQQSRQFKKWLSTLPENTRSTVLTAGLVPWLTSTEEE